MLVARWLAQTTQCSCTDFVWQYSVFGNRRLFGKMDIFGTFVNKDSRSFKSELASPSLRRGDFNSLLSDTDSCLISVLSLRFARALMSAGLKLQLFSVEHLNFSKKLRTRRSFLGNGSYQLCCCFVVDRAGNLLKFYSSLTLSQYICCVGNNNTR